MFFYCPAIFTFFKIASIHLFVGGAHTGPCVHTWRSDYNSIQELVLSYHVDAGNPTQVLQLA